MLGEDRPCSQLEELLSRPPRRFGWLRFWMRTVAWLIVSLVVVVFVHEYRIQHRILTPMMINQSIDVESGNEENSGIRSNRKRRVSHR